MQIRVTTDDHSPVQTGIHMVTQRGLFIAGHQSDTSRPGRIKFVGD